MVRVSIIQMAEHNFNTISNKCVGIVVQHDGLAGHHQVRWRDQARQPYKVAVGNKTHVCARRMLKALPRQLQQANTHLANAQHPPTTATCASSPQIKSLQFASSFQTVNNPSPPIQPSQPSQPRWDRGLVKRRRRSRTARPLYSRPTAR